MRASSALSLALALSGLACPSPEPRCDQLRGARLRALLSTAPGGAELAAIDAPVCVAPGQRMVRVVGGPVRLDAERADAELAARLGHLLLHVREAPPPLEPGPGCAEALARTLDLERAAHEREDQLRVALGLRPAAGAAFERLSRALRQRCEGP